jgi:periplasmic protein TonB
MARRVYESPSSRKDLVISLLVGAALAGALFVAIALVQMIGEVKRPENEIAEVVVAYTAPEIEEVEEEPPPPEEEEEEEPELEAEAPQLSLEQLEVALNPGTGGSLVGDFVMPTVQTTAADLDQVPRPSPSCSPDFPRRLKQKSANGRVVLLVKLDEAGNVVEVAVESSNLPEHDPFVLDAFQSKRCSFTPPTRDGKPVRAQARLPIPIRIG